MTLDPSHPLTPAQIADDIANRAADEDQPDRDVRDPETGLVREPEDDAEKERREGSDPA